MKRQNIVITLFLLSLIVLCSFIFNKPVDNKIEQPKKENISIEKDTLPLYAEAKAKKLKSFSDEEVIASYYAEDFHGRRTSNGEKFDMNALTAAHKTLPFGTKVRIMNVANGKEVVVKINDRGPFIKGRTFDLSKRAFQTIANLKKGKIRVRYQILSEEEESEETSGK